MFLSRQNSKWTHIHGERSRMLPDHEIIVRFETMTIHEMLRIVTLIDDVSCFKVSWSVANDSRDLATCF